MQLPMPLLKKRHILLSPDKTEVGNLVKKAAWIKNPLCCEGGPELQNLVR